MASSISMIAGLGNPGSDYRGTRHNAGADFVEALARQHGATLQAESRFSGLTARIQCAGQDIRLIIPTTFMNRSGQSVAAMANSCPTRRSSDLVAHDELDIPAGTARFKRGGGHGGHNGLRDIVSRLGNNNSFARLRIGIGHPGHASQVTGYVLGRASAVDQARIEASIEAAIDALPQFLAGEDTRAMTQLHSFNAP